MEVQEKPDLYIAGSTANNIAAVGIEIVHQEVIY